METTMYTQLQRREQTLIDAIEGIFDYGYSIKVDSDGKRLTGAKIDTDNVLDARTLMRLTELVARHGFNDFEIARSGGGIRISYLL